MQRFSSKSSRSDTGSRSQTEESVLLLQVTPAPELMYLKEQSECECKRANYHHKVQIADSGSGFVQRTWLVCVWLSVCV